MRVYLVRHIETKEVQGLFWGSLDDIWDQLDELADPLGFEYAPLKPGALYNNFPIGEGRVALQYDDALTEEQEEAGDYFKWDGFSESECFASQLFQQSRLHWRPFDATDVGHGLLARVFARQKREAVE